MGVTPLLSESLLRQIADSLGSLIYATDLDGRFLFANSALEKLWGVPAGGLVGNTREGFLPADVAEKHRANDLAVIQSGRQQASEETDEQADGVHTYLSIKSPLADSDGRMLGVVGVSADITERKQAEHALRRHEDQLRLLFDLASEGLFVADESGRYIDVNDCACEMLGYTRDQLLTMSMGDMSASDDLNVQPIRSDRLRSGKGVVSERRFVRSDGSAFPVEVVARRVPDGRYLEMVRDITERKRAEEELHQAERFNASILETTPNLVYIYDLAETRNVYANREVSEFLGYTPEEIRAFGSALFDNILHPDDADLVARHHARFAQADDDDVLELEYRMRHSSGEWRWLRSRDVLFTRDGQGTPSQILGFTEDITEQKQAAEDLFHEKELYQVTFDSAAVGIAHVAPDGRWLRVNRRLCDILGYTPDELSHLTFADITHPDDVKRTIGDFNAVATRGHDPYSTEKRYVRKDGSVVWAALSVAPICNEDRSLDYMVTVVEDITARKDSEIMIADYRARLDLALQSAEMGVWQWDVLEDRRHFDEQVCHLLGLDFATYTGAPAEFFAVVHPDDVELVRACLTKTLETDAVYDPELRAVWPDGSAHWIAARGRLVRDEAGRPVRISGISWDISERKEAEGMRARAFASITEVVSRVSEQRDPYTAGHQRRVSQLSAAISARMGMPEDQVEEIRLSALIHDVGKMSVPAEILSRPGTLSPLEFELIKRHSEAGYKIIAGANMEGPFAEIVYQHHERCDGSGYPRGLAGDQLLPGAKVIMVADVVEAMASHRPYRAALGIDVALAEIEIGAGSRYDAEVSKACVALFREGDFEFS